MRGASRQRVERTGHPVVTVLRTTRADKPRLARLARLQLDTPVPARRRAVAILRGVDARWATAVVVASARHPSAQALGVTPALAQHLQFARVSPDAFAD